jgi:hypothetical protein
MCNNIHIKKAVFVYDKNKNFIKRYDGVTEVSRVFKLSHLTIKRCANLNLLHVSGHYFCFERLNLSEPLPVTLSLLLFF